MLNIHIGVSSRIMLLIVRNIPVLATCVAVAPFTPRALCQTGSGGTISQSDAFFTQGVSPTVNTGAGAAGANLFFTGATGTDSVFQEWWWYRINGVHTREFCLANASNWSWSGNVGTLNFTTPEFSATLRYVVTDPGLNAARVTSSLTINNTGGTPLNIAMFHYLDIDFAGTAGSDAASLTGPNQIFITDTVAGAPFNTMRAYYESAAADSFQCTGFATLRAILSDTVVNNLSGIGLPFGPGDWTGAYQFNRTIPVGGSTTASVVFGVEPNQPRCIADVDNGSGTGTPDGGVTIEDLLYYLGLFEAGDTRADVDDGTGTGTRDGGVTIEDLLYFLFRFEAGC